MKCSRQLLIRIYNYNLWISSPHGDNVCFSIKGNPGAYTPILQIGVQSIGEILVIVRIGDKTGVIIKGFVGERVHVSDEVFRGAGTTEEEFGDLSLGFVDCADAYW